VGSVAAPSGALARIMVEWERGVEPDAALVTAYRGQLAYWLLRRHAWGRHQLCPWLHPLLGLTPEDLGCLGAHPYKHPPPAVAVDLW